MRFFSRQAFLLGRMLGGTLLLAVLLFLSTAEAAPPTRFTVHVSGEGPDVLLIPGLACPASVWEATVARLKATRRVHVLQVAGFADAPVAGHAEGPVVAPLVEAISAYIAEEKLVAPAIIGHSLGGFAAMALAAWHPEQVGRVMVVDSSPFFPMLRNAGATVESVRPGADAMRDQITSLPQPMFAMSQVMILQQMVKDPAKATALAAETGKSDPKAVARAMHDLMTTDLRPELSAIRVPLTVLYAFDEADGPAAAKVERLMVAGYANAKAARFLRMEGSRHFIMFDQPEKFAAAVDEFLQ
jgi:pimeloyl-ACP methyl ester carboxylesterase